MADKIIEVQTVTISGSAYREITLPNVKNAIGNTQTGSQWWPHDRIKYVFQNFSGSFLLVQDSGTPEGLQIHDHEPQYVTDEWRLIATPPQWLYTSGSNEQDVEVVKILIR